MKSVIVLLCALCLAHVALGQKTIKGKVYELNQSEGFVQTQAYVVFLKKKERSIRRDTLMKMETSGFELTINEAQLQKYKFIEFSKAPYDGTLTETVQISTIKPDSFDVILGDGNSYNDEVQVLKPAIYLYPRQETPVSIRHTFKGTILNTFPEYKDGWNVIASPGGKLKNVADDRSYNYLFWDGSTRFNAAHYQYKNGFYVARKEIIPFLQQRLAQMGLNETEINDFIVYWLPALSKNETNFIHFWVNDDIDHTSRLEVTPNPETVMRIFMEYKAYDGKSPKLPEQSLPQTPRIGFVLVEWGGGAIGTSRVE